MKKIIISFLAICLCIVMSSRLQPVYASDNSLIGAARGTYMSSAKVYGKVIDENDVIGNALVTCLAKVSEIDVDMYLQRAYGNEWKNVTEAYNMNMKDVAELDESAIIYNVSPGTYRVYIVATAIGYDGLLDTMDVGTGSFIINT